MRSPISLAILAIVAAAAAAPAQRPLKVYISADMEGITGVASVDQLGPANFEYAQARQWMTADVLAAIQGAREAGATEFVISDSHGNGQSLLIDRFPTDIPITIVRSFPRPLGMMEGLDSSFAAAIFIGYHASTSSLTGVRAHTISSALLTRIAIAALMPASDIEVPLIAMRVSSALEIVCARTPVRLDVDA